jgi:WD40 repeat protein/CHAT domain-containing protein/Tfp pilus assembly protein PilF
MVVKETVAAVLALTISLGAADAWAQEPQEQAQPSQVQAPQPEAPADQGKVLFDQGKYAEALVAAEEEAKAVEKDEIAKGARGVLTADALNSAAWYALFAKRFERALEAGDRALVLAPAYLPIQGNRAHALMFLGRPREALEIYVEHKGEMAPGFGKWEDIVVQDFDELEKRGLVHPQMAAVKAALAAAPDSPRVLWQNAAELVKASKAAEAVPLLEKYAEDVKKLRGADHPDYANALRELSVVLGLVGRSAETEPLLRQALAIDEKSYGPEHPIVAGELDSLGTVLGVAGRYAEAETAVRRSLAIDEKLYGLEHPKLADRLNILAMCFVQQNKLEEAETTIRRALAIEEKLSGPESPKVSDQLTILSFVLSSANRLADAEPLMRRALAIIEKTSGPEDPKAAPSFINLAKLLQETNRLTEAEQLYRRALANTEKNFGPEHPNVAVSLHTLANLLKETNRLTEAEPQYRRAMVIIEKNFGPDHPLVAENLGELAKILQQTNRLTEAEQAFRRALTVVEASRGPDHPETAMAINELAALLQQTNRVAEAEPLMRRALAILEKSYGPDHPGVASGLRYLAEQFLTTGRLAEAEPLLRRALSIDEKSYGADNPKIASDLSSLALLLEQTNRHAEAEPLYQRTLAIFEESYGLAHPNVARTLISMALLLQQTGRQPEAEPLLRRALAISEQSYGPEHPDAALSLDHLVALQINKGDWVSAFASARRSTAIHIASARKMRSASGGAETRQLALSVGQFKVHALVAFHAARGDAEARDEAFALAQRSAANEAAGSLTQAQARFAVGDGALAVLAREQQDLEGQIEALDKLLLDALGKADKAAGEAARAEQGKAQARLREVTARIAREHPDYLALVNPEPISIRAVQALLAPDEVLVQFLDVASWPGSLIPETAFAFVIARSEARWVELPLGSKALADRVTALRCGLDASAWTDEPSPCAKALGKEISETAALPFDLARAHALYRDLFGQVEDVIKNKRLLIAPSGALTQLPFQALVATAPDPAVNGPDAYARAAWLGARNAISVLPSAASLRLLRMGRQGQAADPFLGFGNPLLTGGGGDRRAWERQDCQKSAARPGGRRGLNRITASSQAGFYHGAAADVEMLRQAAPLPETADELCSVARYLGASDSAVYLGERATVSQIKSLSASGALGRAGTIHFATHGLLAGETAQFAHNTAEPALLMTPPGKDKVTPEDDGLLKASDVTGLKLNADWVVLSACNTASGGEGGEALSGLARAFFYAGARSMLVSHWYVDSNAAVEITTGAFSALKANPGIGRDEALRRSLAALIAKGGPKAHPSVWAPFVLVGDGGRTTTQTASVQPASPVEPASRAESGPGAPASSAPTRSLKHNGVGRLTAFSSDGRRMVADAQGEIKVWDLGSGAEPRVISGASAKSVNALAFSKDGRRVLASVPNGAVMIWDAETGALQRKLTGMAGADKTFSFSADGRLLAAATADGKSISVWEIDKGQLYTVFSLRGGARFSRDAVILSPNGRYVAAEQYSQADHKLSIGVWDVETERLKRHLDVQLDDIRSLAFSGDGGRLAVVDSKGALVVFNSSTGKPEITPKGAVGVMRAAFSSEGRWLAWTNAGGDIKLWDTQTGREGASISGQGRAINSLAFSPDGASLQLGLANGVIELWKTPGPSAKASSGGR